MKPKNLEMYINLPIASSAQFKMVSQLFQSGALPGSFISITEIADAEEVSEPTIQSGRKKGGRSTK